MSLYVKRRIAVNLWYRTGTRIKRLSYFYNSVRMEIKDYKWRTKRMLQVIVILLLTGLAFFAGGIVGYCCGKEE